MTNFEGDENSRSKTSLADPEPSSKTQSSKRRRRRRRGRKASRNNPVSAHASPEATNTKKTEQKQERKPSQRSSAEHKRNTTNTSKRPEQRAGAKPDSATTHRHRKRHNRYKHDIHSRPAYGALDLGTNNCRLLIAVPYGTRFRVIDAFSRIVRLGEGIAHAGRLSDAAMDRAVDALKVCARKIDMRQLKRQRLIATEACRVAENGHIFLDRVRQEVGIELEIVNGETEARLAVAGCSSLIDLKSRGAILFDIGGGSSELVWIDLSARRRWHTDLSKCIRNWTSLPVGVVNISERYGGVSVTPAIFESMVEEVTHLLDDFPEADTLSALARKGDVHMLGTSGTVTTLAGVHLGLKQYDRSKVDGLWMSSDDVTAMTGKLLGMSFEERALNACIGQDRADLVLAGCAILEAIRRKWPCSRLRVADRGLREGILYELMGKDGVLRPYKKPNKRRQHLASQTNSPSISSRKATERP